MRIWGAVFGPADMQYRRPKVEEIQVSSPAFMICAVLHRCLPIRVIGEILGRSENQVDRIIRRYVGSRGGRPKRLFGSSTKPKRDHNLQNSLQNFSRKSANYWSGRRESNPRMQLGKLPFYH